MRGRLQHSEPARELASPDLTGVADLTSGAGAPFLPSCALLKPFAGVFAPLFAPVSTLLLSLLAQNCNFSFRCPTRHPTPQFHVHHYHPAPALQQIFPFAYTPHSSALPPAEPWRSVMHAAPDCKSMAHCQNNQKCMQHGAALPAYGPPRYACCRCCNSPRALPSERGILQRLDCFHIATLASNAGWVQGVHCWRELHAQEGGGGSQGCAGGVVRRRGEILGRERRAGGWWKLLLLLSYMLLLLPPPQAAGRHREVASRARWGVYLISLCSVMRRRYLLYFISSMRSGVFFLFCAVVRQSGATGSRQQGQHGGAASVSKTGRSAEGVAGGSSSTSISTASGTGPAEHQACRMLQALAARHL